MDLDVRVYLISGIPPKCLGSFVSSNHLLSAEIACNLALDNQQPTMATTNSPDEIVRAPDSIELGLAKIPAAATTKDSDPFLVAFDQPYDFENPMNWPAGRKWMVTDVLSATGFNRIMVSTIMAPALTAIGSDLHMSSTEAAMSMSIYILATAFGPMVVGPLAEIYGRQIILHTSSVWFFIWNLVCGFATTKEILIASRFLAGFGASSIYALAGGVLSDIWTPEQRGSSLGVYLLIPLLASAVGKYCTLGFSGWVTTEQ